MRRVLIAGGVALGLAGCASSAQEVTVAYVSPILYDTYTCEQLGRAAEHMSARQNPPRSPAAVMVVPWPAASLAKGNGGYVNEPGQIARIEQASAAKQCAVPPPPRTG